ncbi:hypothetical protein F4780DRAFT_795164 [Xylariomycetidae sp. FL0641]|nr:hypothetical protein F4780DRAFT_795164 [Xylariomycetidae sp. FL0641]
MAHQLEGLSQKLVSVSNRSTQTTIFSSPRADHAARDERTGTLYYVPAMTAPLLLFAERVNAPRDRMLALASSSLVLPPGTGPVPILLDFVGGRAGATTTTIEGRDLQCIHISSNLAGEQHVAVPGSLLNKKPVRVAGSGLGAFGMLEMKKQVLDLSGGIRGGDAKTRGGSRCTRNSI